MAAAVWQQRHGSSGAKPAGGDQSEGHTSASNLDRPRQLLDRPRRMQCCSQPRRARQLLDSHLTGSTSKALRTAPRARQRLDGSARRGLERQPDSSTASQSAAPADPRQGSGRQAGPQCVGSRSVNGASGPARRYTTPPALLLPLGSARKAGRIQTFSTVSVAHRTSPRRPEPTRYHRRSELS